MKIGFSGLGYVFIREKKKKRKREGERERILKTIEFKRNKV